MNESKNFEHLNILTKKEIIEFLNNNYWYKAPTEYEVNYFKWEKESDKISEEMDKHCNSDRSTILVEKINNLIDKCNAEKVLQKKIVILEKIEIYKQDLKNFHKEFDVLIERDKKNNKFLDKIKAKSESN